MTWHDVLLAGEPSHEELRAAFAAAFGLHEDDVAVVDSILEAKGGAAIVVEVRQARGDFRQHLSVFAAAAHASARPATIIQRVCDTLRLNALISDQSTNPYSMLLVVTGASIRQVTLDPERLDRDGEYVLQ